MKLQPRKDKPEDPIIPQSECWAGLRLVKHTLDGVVSQGDVPEEVVRRAIEFSEYLDRLAQEHDAWPSNEDRATLEAAILAGTLPTLRTTKSAEL